MGKLIAVITAGLFAAGTILAADPDKCAQHVAACKDLVAKFNLSAEGNRKLFLQYLDRYQQGGCTPRLYQAVMMYADIALKTSPEPKQLETFKAGCRQIPAE